MGRCAGVDGSVGNRQGALDAREVLIECKALISSGLAVRCDECRISLVPFNELCELQGGSRGTGPGHVDVGGSENLTWRGAPDPRVLLTVHPPRCAYCNVACRQVVSRVCRGGRATDTLVVSGFVECFV